VRRLAEIDHRIGLQRTVEVGELLVDIARALVLDLGGDPARIDPQHDQLVDAVEPAVQRVPPLLLGRQVDEAFTLERRGAVLAGSLRAIPVRRVVM
jgi:hypothetical protein